jgi:hypothetical protein
MFWRHILKINPRSGITESRGKMSAILFYIAEFPFTGLYYFALLPAICESVFVTECCQAFEFLAINGEN